MKKSFLLIISILTLNFIYSQNFKLSKNSISTQIVVDFSHEISPFQYTNINGYDFVDFNKTHKITSLQKGKPCLPRFGESILLPATGKSSYEITFESIEIFENIEVAPSKGNLKRNVNPAEIPFEFGETYSKNEFYPQEIVTLNKAFNLRSLRGQVISVCPFQYNPVTKTLKVYKGLQIVVHLDQNQIGENELNIAKTQKDEHFYQSMFLNSKKSDENTLKYTQIEEEGELLIIASEEYEDSITDLIKWKHSKGIKTHLKFTSEFGSTSDEIKNSISDFYDANPNLKFVLLVGDNQQIPAYSYGTSWDNEALISDSYYGQLTGNDYYPELLVGRFSGTSSQVATMVKRTLEYEKNPAAGDWMTKAIGLGSSEGAGYGDDDQADWQHLRAIRTQLLDYGYTQVHEFYDGSRGQEDASGNPNSALISPAVNDGVGLFNYTGHGALNTCITGNYSSTNINAGTNNGKYPFVISVACNNGTFTAGTCISETWLRATENNTPSGAIAACGSSILMAWAPPMQTQDEMTNLIVESNSANKVTSLGALFYNAQLSMLENYPDDGIEVMQTWVLFGDPSTEFRTKTTQNLNVQHLTSINANQEITVEFTSSNEGALIALTQDSIFIGSAKITNGNASIVIPASSAFAPISVVGTLQNFKPYEGEITILHPASLETIHATKFKLYPNPVKDNFTVESSINNYEISLYTVGGQKVMQEEINGMNTKSINCENLPNGVYFLNLRHQAGIEIIKIIIGE
jgi:gingipain R